MVRLANRMYRMRASFGLVLLRPHSSFHWLQPGHGGAAFSTLRRATQYRTWGTRGKEPGPQIAA